MGEDALRRRLPGGHEHGRPVDGVEAEDVLPHQVVVDRPPPREPLPVGAVAHGGAVVDQGVEPDVGDVLRVPGDRDAPADRRPGDREVLEALTDEPQHLVAAGLGLDGVRVGLVVLQQPVAVAGELEEVVLLPHPLHRPAVDRAVAVGQLVFGVVGLAGHAVEALVGAELDVAVVVDLLEHLLHGPVVAGLGRADEVVVADPQLFPGLGEAFAGPVGPVLRGEALSLGGLGHLETVLVGTGEEKHLIAPQTAPPGQHIGRDGGVGVADMGNVVDVIDGCGDGEGWHVCLPRLLDLGLTIRRLHD